MLGEALHRDGAHGLAQLLLSREVPVGGRGRHPGAAGGLADADRLGPALGGELDADPHELLAQMPVMIGRASAVDSVHMASLPWSV